jgi:hypothetical protein
MTCVTFTYTFPALVPNLILYILLQHGPNSLWCNSIYYLAVSGSQQYSTDTVNVGTGLHYRPKNIHLLESIDCLKNTLFFRPSRFLHQVVRVPLGHVVVDHDDHVTAAPRKSLEACTPGPCYC